MTERTFWMGEQSLKATSPLQLSYIVELANTHTTRNQRDEWVTLLTLTNHTLHAIDSCANAPSGCRQHWRCVLLSFPSPLAVTSQHQQRARIAPSFSWMMFVLIIHLNPMKTTSELHVGA